MHGRTLVCSVLIGLFLFPAGGQTQQGPQASPQQGGMGGGIASGVASKPVYDEQNRPITAGGFVDKGPIIFEDITKKAGLSGWVHKMGVPREELHRGDQRIRRVPDRLRQRWMAGHLPGQRRDLQLARRQRRAAARRAVPQQPRRHVHRCIERSRRTERSLGLWLLGRRLRQRWLARPLRRQLRQESALPQQSRRHVHRRSREGRRGAWQLVARLGVGRLRRRRVARSLRHRLRALRSRQSAHRGNARRWATHRASIAARL